VVKTSNYAKIILTKLNENERDASLTMIDVLKWTAIGLCGKNRDICLNNF